MRKGMSLAIETTVVIALAIIVLVALLLFFAGTFTPATERIKLEQRKVDLCTKYVRDDSECRSPANDDIKKGEKGLDETCEKLGLSTNPAICCSGYCSRKRCEELDGACQTVAISCDKLPIPTKPLDGACPNAGEICCTKS